MNKFGNRECIGFNKSLLNDGFVHMKGMLAEHDVLHVKHILDELFKKYSQLSPTFAKIHDQNSAEQSRYNIYEINRAIQQVGTLNDTEVFKACKLLISTIKRRNMYYSYDHAIYKESKSGSVMWHQDQAYKSRVKNMKSIHLWIPLHDISIHGGGMQYVSASHKGKLFHHERVEKSYSLSVHDDCICRDKVVQCNVSVGDVIAHLPMTLHSSLPNNSDSVRKAWILHFSPYGQFEPLLPSNLLYYAKSKIKTILKS